MRQNSDSAQPLADDQAISDSRLERGWFFDDDTDEKAFRVAMSRRIAARMPIFPDRALGLEYAALTDDLPRGCPVAAVALANLRIGESFSLCGRTYAVQAIAKTLRFLVTGSGGTTSSFRTSPDANNWEQFCRDVDGLLVASAHGCDAGALLAAWRRDPISRPIS